MDMKNMWHYAMLQNTVAPGAGAGLDFRPCEPETRLLVSSGPTTDTSGLMWRLAVTGL